MSPSSDRIRLHELRQLYFDELDPSAKAELEARLARDPEAQKRWKGLNLELSSGRASSELVDAITERLAARTPRSVRPSTHQRWPAPQWLAAAAATIGLVLITVPRGAPPDGQSTRTKGLAPAARPACSMRPCPSLEMYVKDKAGIRKGMEGARLRSGDWVQFRYRAEGRSHLYVVSLDDDHVLAPLYPDYRGQSVPIQPAGRHILPGSIILDDAIGPERIYAFFSEGPIDFEQIERAFSDVADPTTAVDIATLPASVAQVSILIEKVP
ncbi:MAG: hypothetical protein AAFN74_25455 [Myxococcota bacterium]